MTADESSRITRRKRVVRIILAALALVVVLCVALALYLVNLWRTGDRLNRDTMFNAEQHDVSFAREGEEPASEPNQEPDIEVDASRVYHNGKYYTLNQDLFTVLFLGIDARTETQFDNIGINSNQADSLIMMVIDPVSNQLTAINIPRNSITAVKQLDANMNYARTTQSPICIQHAFGDGKGLSCELTREAASNLLFGLTIHRYISMNFDGLITANDAIGGVTLELLDDYTALNKKMQKGAEYTLMGEEARAYVASRLMAGLDGTNMSRVKRQVQYYKGFFKKAKDRLKDDPLFMVGMLAKMQDAIYTDLSMDEMVYLSKTVTDMDLKDDGIFTLPGNAQENEDYIVDDENLKDMIIQIFYKEVQE